MKRPQKAVHICVQSNPTPFERSDRIDGADLPRDLVCLVDTIEKRHLEGNRDARATQSDPAYVHSDPNRSGSTRLTRPRSPIPITTERPCRFSSEPRSNSVAQSLNLFAATAILTTAAPVARIARARSSKSLGIVAKS